MGKINKVSKQTTNPYLNLYDLDVVNKVGREDHYYVASRAKTEDDLKLSHIENNDPDGVAIYSLYGQKKDKVVLIRQFRYPLGGEIRYICKKHYKYNYSNEFHKQKNNIKTYK